LAPPDDEAHLAAGLVKAGFSLDALNQSGVFKMRDHVRSPSDLRPFFRGRLIIPIREALQGEVIAFTARQLFCTPQDEPSYQAKYLNTRESPVFRKSDVLFNLDRARRAIDKGNQSFLIVEGQLDALRCWEKGLPTAVAPQGTAITENQIARLKRYGQRLEILLDGDAAGRRAALRVLPMAVAQEMEVTFLNLPDGTDPDSLLREEGAEGLTKLRSSALPAMRFAARACLPEEAGITPQARAAAMRKLCEIIARSPSHVARQAYLEEASRALGISSEAAGKDFRNFLNRQTPHRTPTESETPEPSLLTNLSKDLLCLILANPDLLAKISEIIDTEWVDPSSTEGVILLKMIAEVREGLWENLSLFTAQLDDDAETNALYALQARPVLFADPLRAANDTMQGIYREYLRRRTSELRLRELNLPPHSPEQLAVAQERLRLNQLKLKALPTIQP
jgi:DNA primase